MKVDFYRHDLQPSDADRIAKVLATPFLTTGQVSRQVEAQLRNYFSVPHACLVNSWTNGALAVLLAMDLKPEDEVIVPAMTFIASANVVELAGARIVFADVEPGSLLLTPEIVAKHVTKRTKVVMPVHIYGQLCDVEGIRKAIDNHPARSGQVRIVEDAAHCFEGEFRGEKPGRFGDVAIFSFYATKNVTCGEGGAIIVRDGDLFQRVLEARLHGMSAIAVDRFASGKYNHWDMNRLGTKANLPDILAALLPNQIETIDQRLPQRQAVADRYREAFGNGPLRLVREVADTKCAEHIFTIGVPNSGRDQAIAALNAAGINVTVNFRSVTDTHYYKQKYPTASANCPNACLWGEQTLTLPMYPSLTLDEQDHVIKTVREQVYPLARPHTQ
jgi:UDP-4-amino-4-deoxy-L-arabinose-oxoglutarate aminotransferase